MEHQPICKWLGLPTDSWPPDHYSLLGLKSGEGDVALIEQHAHDRLAKLRCYQLSHPEQATEAMNRLAQAFMCLSDPASKREYDLQRAGLRAGSAAATTGESTSATVAVANVSDDTAVGPKTQVDWRQTPPPVRGPALMAATVASANEHVDQPETACAAATETVAAPTRIPASTPASVPDVPIGQAVSPPPECPATSFDARRGLGTFPALIERIDLTRQLLIAWDKAGRYLNRPKRRLSRDSEQIDLTRRLEQIHDSVARFPPIVGKPGQPGYRVVAMARLEMTALMFGMLDAQQREALARDWLAGRVVLLEHRTFLLREFKARRRLSLFRRGFRACRAFINDHPGWSATIALVVLSAVGVLGSLLW
ncbi:MAG: hypothetical protein FJ271_06400 [Planctomycetes bacterium]|nr:hypothetical protein [Planctomycetota bacterium]